VSYDDGIYLVTNTGERNLLYRDGLFSLYSDIGLANQIENFIALVTNPDKDEVTFKGYSGDGGEASFGFSLLSSEAGSSDDYGSKLLLWTGKQGDWAQLLVNNTDVSVELTSQEKGSIKADAYPLSIVIQNKLQTHASGLHETHLDFDASRVFLGFDVKDLEYKLTLMTGTKAAGFHAAYLELNNSNVFLGLGKSEDGAEHLELPESGYINIDGGNVWLGWGKDSTYHLELPASGYININDGTVFLGYGSDFTYHLELPNTGFVKVGGEAATDECTQMYANSIIIKGGSSDSKKGEFQMIDNNDEYGIEFDTKSIKTARGTVSASVDGSKKVGIEKIDVAVNGFPGCQLYAASKPWKEPA
jgi:hypothetical protein